MCVSQKSEGEMLWCKQNNSKFEMKAWRNDHLIWFPPNHSNFMESKRTVIKFYRWDKMFAKDFSCGSVVKNLPAKQKTWVWSLGREDPLEKEVATHSSILAWEIPWTEEPGGLQSMLLQKVRHNLAAKQQQKCSPQISSLSLALALKM